MSARCFQRICHQYIFFGLAVFAKGHPCPRPPLQCPEAVRPELQRVVGEGDDAGPGRLLCAARGQVAQHGNNQVIDIAIAESPATHTESQGQIEQHNTI